MLLPKSKSDYSFNTLVRNWADIAPQTGAYSLIQPTIQKIYKSRQLEDSLFGLDEW